MSTWSWKASPAATRSPDGSRHIMAFLVPGDLKHMDHSIATLSPCEILDLSRDRVLELFERPAIARALWCMTLVDGATLKGMAG